MSALEESVRCFLVSGKVQGVFFRQSTRVEAQRLGIRGYARNLPDGAVQILARGRSAAVEEVRRWLHRGPPQARVDSVQEIGVSAAVLGDETGFMTE